MKAYDLVIAGGGPAGLSAAQYGSRAGLQTLVVEQDRAGGQANLIHNLENYPGNKSGKSGTEIMQIMLSQALEAGSEFIKGRISSIEKNGSSFNLTTEDGSEITSKAVILACGATHNTLGVAGETELLGCGVSYCAACDGPFFKNKKIFVVGGGDAACGEAFFLGKISKDIHLIHRRGELRAQKSIAKRIIDDPAINIQLNTRILEIKGSEKVESVLLEDTKSGKTHEESADAVFIFTGIIPNTGIIAASASEWRPKLDKNGFVMTDETMASSIEGIFAAGDIRSTPFRQVVTACGDGAIAAHSASEYIAGL
ncbi:MAG: thioredoxin-disulfide reductase [Termitinemataceae bacterium]|nr:MAG: thioredoxin-disulfide reductase [Termitinemataceae bacterium]